MTEVIFQCVLIRGLQAQWVPMGPDTLSPFGPGSGHFLYFFYRSGSGRTRAHLASLFLLCLCTRRAHMAAV